MTALPGPVDPLIPSDDEVYLAKLESLITPDPGASLLDSFARTPTVFNPPMKPGADGLIPPAKPRLPRLDEVQRYGQSLVQQQMITPQDLEARMASMAGGQARADIEAFNKVAASGFELPEFPSSEKRSPEDKPAGEPSAGEVLSAEMVRRAYAASRGEGSPTMPSGQEHIPGGQFLRDWKVPFRSVAEFVGQMNRQYPDPRATIGGPSMEERQAWARSGEEANTKAETRIARIDEALRTDNPSAMTRLDAQWWADRQQELIDQANEAETIRDINPGLYGKMNAKITAGLAVIPETLIEYWVLAAATAGLGTAIKAGTYGAKAKAALEVAAKSRAGQALGAATTAVRGGLGRAAAPVGRMLDRGLLSRYSAETRAAMAKTLETFAAELPANVGAAAIQTAIDPTVPAGKVRGPDAKVAAISAEQVATQRKAVADVLRRVVYEDPEGYTAKFVTNVAERLGGVLGATSGRFAAEMGSRQAIANGLARSRIVDWIVAQFQKNNTKTARAMRAGGIDTVLSEGLEERFEDILRSATGLDEKPAAWLELTQKLPDVAGTAAPGLFGVDTEGGTDPELEALKGEALTDLVAEVAAFSPLSWPRMVGTAIEARQERKNPPAAAPGAVPPAGTVPPVAAPAGTVPPATTTPGAASPVAAPEAPPAAAPTAAGGPEIISAPPEKPELRARPVGQVQPTPVAREAFESDPDFAQVATVMPEGTEYSEYNNPENGKRVVMARLPTGASIEFSASEGRTLYEDIEAKADAKFPGTSPFFPAKVAWIKQQKAAVETEYGKPFDQLANRVAQGAAMPMAIKDKNGRDRTFSVLVGLTRGLSPEATTQASYEEVLHSVGMLADSGIGLPLFESKDPNFVAAMDATIPEWRSLAKANRTQLENRVASELMANLAPGRLRRAAGAAVTSLDSQKWQKLWSAIKDRAFEGAVRGLRLLGFLPRAGKRQFRPITTPEKARAVANAMRDALGANKVGRSLRVESQQVADAMWRQMSRQIAAILEVDDTPAQVPPAAPQSAPQAPTAAKPEAASAPAPQAPAEAPAAPAAKAPGEAAAPPPPTPPSPTPPAPTPPAEAPAPPKAPAAEAAPPPATSPADAQAERAAKQAQAMAAFRKQMMAQQAAAAAPPAAAPEAAAPAPQAAPAPAPAAPSAPAPAPQPAPTQAPSSAAATGPAPTAPAPAAPAPGPAAPPTAAPKSALEAALDEAVRGAWSLGGEAKRTGVGFRYVHKDGRGLMNNESLNYDKLTDDEYFEVEDGYLSLRQPMDVPAGATFAFTAEGEAQHKRLIQLLTKASKSAVRRQKIDLSNYVVVWESDDGQLALQPRPAASRSEPSSPISGGASLKRPVATFFSGIGTMEAALTGVSPQLVAEYDPDIQAEYNRSHGAKFTARSIVDVSPTEVRDSGAVLFHASPECKRFSIANRDRSPNDLDLLSAKAVAAVIREARPPAVTVENVPQYQDTELLGLITQALDEAGYTHRTVVMDAADLGAPQRRKRMLVQAVLNGELPALPAQRPAGDWYAAIQDLIPAAPKDELPQWERVRLDAMMARGAIDGTKPIITMGGSINASVVSAANAGGPAPTLKAGNQVPRLVLPGGDVRRVTPRMMARLMSLPDSFPVPANSRMASRVLGNGMQGEFTRALVQPLVDQVAPEGIASYSLSEEEFDRKARTVQAIMGAALTRADAPERTIGGFATTLANAFRDRKGDPQKLQSIIEFAGQYYEYLADTNTTFPADDGTPIAVVRPSPADVTSAVAEAQRVFSSPAAPPQPPTPTPAPVLGPPRAAPGPRPAPAPPAWKAVADQLRQRHSINVEEDLSGNSRVFVITSTLPEVSVGRAALQVLAASGITAGSDRIRAEGGIARRKDAYLIASREATIGALLRFLDKSATDAERAGGVVDLNGGENGGARPRAVAGDDRKSGEFYRGVVPEDIQELINRGTAVPEDVRQNQIEDIGMAENARQNNEPVFLVSSAAGSGKTFVLGGIAALAQRDGKSVLWVTVNNTLISQAQRDLSAFPDSNKVLYTTYAQLRATEKANQPLPSVDVVLLDEVHNARNLETATGELIQRLLEKVEFSVLASATMAENPTGYQFLEATGLFDRESIRVGQYRIEGFTAWAIRYGAQLKQVTRKINGQNVEGFEAVWDPTPMAMFAAQGVPTWFIRQGLMTRREMVLDATMVANEFVSVQPPDRFVEMQRNWENVYTDAKKLLKKIAVLPQAVAVQLQRMEMHRVNTMKRQLEASKLAQVVGLAQAELAAGRNVLVLVGQKTALRMGEARYNEEYRKLHKSDKGINDYQSNETLVAAMEEYQKDFDRVALTVRDMAELAAWQKENPPPFAQFIYALALAARDRGIPFRDITPLDEFNQAFGDDVVNITGDTSDNQVEKAVAAWRAGQGPRVLLGTIFKLGTGFSLHAMDPSAPPQTMILATLPWSPSVLEQSLFRIVRYGMAHKAKIVFPFITTDPMEARLRTVIGSRLRTLRLTVSGDDSAVGSSMANTGMALGEAATGFPYSPIEWFAGQPVIAARAFAGEFLRTRPGATRVSALSAGMARVLRAIDKAVQTYEAIITAEAIHTGSIQEESDHAVFRNKVDFMLKSGVPDMVRNELRKEFGAVPRSNDGIWMDEFVDADWPTQATAPPVITAAELDAMVGQAVVPLAPEAAGGPVITSADTGPVRDVALDIPFTTISLERETQPEEEKPVRRPRLPSLGRGTNTRLKNVLLEDMAEWANKKIPEDTGLSPRVEETVQLPKGSLMGNAVQVESDNAGNKVPGYYAVVELGWIRPSHNWTVDKEVRAFVPSEEYSKSMGSAQYREYDVAKGGRANSRKVVEFAVALMTNPMENGRYFVNNDPARSNGPPIVTERGMFVINGNGRVMVMQVAYSSGREAVKKAMARLIGNNREYGIAEEDVLAMRRPVLLRVVGLIPGSPATVEMAADAPNQLQEGVAREAAKIRSFMTPGLLKLFRDSEDSTIEAVLRGPGQSLLTDLVNDPAFRLQKSSLVQEQGGQMVPTARLVSLVSNAMVQEVLPANLVEQAATDHPSLHRGIMRSAVALLDLKAQQLADVDRFLGAYAEAAEFLVNTRPTDVEKATGSLPAKFVTALEVRRRQGTVWADSGPPTPTQFTPMVGAIINHMIATADAPLQMSKGFRGIVEGYLRDKNRRRSKSLPGMDVMSEAVPTIDELALAALQSHDSLKDAGYTVLPFDPARPVTETNSLRPDVLADQYGAAVDPNATNAQGGDVAQYSLGVEFELDQEPLRWSSILVGLLNPSPSRREYPKARGPKAAPVFGFSHQATEALWHLLGGPRSPYQPMQASDPNGGLHYFLRHRETGKVIDPLVATFTNQHDVPDYAKGVPADAMADKPSPEARGTIKRAKARAEQQPQLRTVGGSPVMQSILQFRISGNGPNQVLHASLRSGRATAESVADSIRTEQPMVVAVDAPGKQPLKKFAPITAALRDLGYKVDVGVYNAQDFGAAVSEVSTILRATRVGELPDLPKPVAPGAWKWTASTHSISDYRNGRYFGVIPSRNVDVIPMPVELKAFLAEQGIQPELLDEEFLVVGTPGKYRVAMASQPVPALQPGDPIPLVVYPNGQVARLRPRTVQRMYAILPGSFGIGLEGTAYEAAPLATESLLAPIPDLDDAGRIMPTLTGSPSGDVVRAVVAPLFAIAEAQGSVDLYAYIDRGVPLRWVRAPSKFIAAGLLGNRADSELHVWRQGQWVNVHTYEIGEVVLKMAGQPAANAAAPAPAVDPYLTAEAVENRKQANAKLLKDLGDPEYWGGKQRRLWLQHLATTDPVVVYTDLPHIATTDDVMQGRQVTIAGETQQVGPASPSKRPQWGMASKIAPGTEIDSRLDIPSYMNNNLWMTTLHATNNTVLAYEPGVRLTNVRFPGHGEFRANPDGTMTRVTSREQKRSLGIAQARHPKGPFAKIRGRFAPLADVGALVQYAREALAKSLDPANVESRDRWVQVGFNPRRHDYYYDRSEASGRFAVVSAEEMVQLGNLVLARNPVLIDTEVAAMEPSLRQTARANYAAESATQQIMEAMAESQPTAPSFLYSLAEQERPSEKVWRVPSNYPYLFAELGKEIEKSRGLWHKPRLREWLETLMEFPMALGRTNYYIPHGFFQPELGRKYTPALKAFQELSQVNRRASQRAQDWFTHILQPLAALPQDVKRQAYDLFEKTVIFQNLVYTTDPNGLNQKWFSTPSRQSYDHANSQAELAHLRAHIATQPQEVQDAIAESLRRREQERYQMVSQAVAIGVPGLTMDAVNNEAFYHQQVHEALGVLGAEGSMYQGTGKPSVLRRPGATLAREADLEGMSFNTNFLEAEFEWTREFAHRIMTQTILQRDIRDKYDRMPEMAEKADKRNWETACRCVADPAIPGNPTDAVATAKQLAADFRMAGTPTDKSNALDAIDAWLAGTSLAGVAARAKRKNIRKVLTQWRRAHDPLFDYDLRMGRAGAAIEKANPGWGKDPPHIVAMTLRKMQEEVYTRMSLPQSPAQRKETRQLASALAFMIDHTQIRHTILHAGIQAARKAKVPIVPEPQFVSWKDMLTESGEDLVEFHLGPDKIFSSVWGMADRLKAKAIDDILVAAHKGDVAERVKEMEVVVSPVPILVPPPVAKQLAQLRAPESSNPVVQALRVLVTRPWNKMASRLKGAFLTLWNPVKTNISNVGTDLPLLRMLTSPVPAVGGFEVAQALNNAGKLLEQANPVRSQETRGIIKAMDNASVFTSGIMEDLLQIVDVNQMPLVKELAGAQQTAFGDFLDRLKISGGKVDAIVQLAEAMAAVPDRLIRAAGDSTWMIQEPGQKFLASMRAKYGPSFTNDVAQTVVRFARFGQAREDQFRVAAFLLLRETILRHNGKVPWSMASRERIEELYRLYGADEAAGYAARQYLGDYTEVSLFARMLEPFVLFSKWPDTVIGRNAWFLRNILQDMLLGNWGNVGQAVGRVAYSEVPVYLWNWYLVGYVQSLLRGHGSDDDDEPYSWAKTTQPWDRLSEADRERPLVILPFMVNGKQALLRNVSMFGDAAILTGYRQALTTVQKAAAGQISVPQAVIRVLTSPLAANYQRAIGGLNPFIKTVGFGAVPKRSPLYDALAGMAGTGDGLTMPIDATSDTAYQRPAGEIISRNFGLESQYLWFRHWMDPSVRRRPRREWLASYFVSLADPAINAMGEMHQAVNQFNQQRGVFTGAINPVSEYRDMRAAAIANDKETFLAGYRKMAETDPDRGYRAFVAHLGKLNPISRLKAEEQEEFRAQLTAEQKAKAQLVDVFTTQVRQRMWEWYYEAVKADKSQRGTEQAREVTSAILTNLEALAAARTLRKKRSDEKRGLDPTEERDRRLGDREERRAEAAEWFLQRKGLITLADIRQATQASDIDTRRRLQKAWETLVNAQSPAPR